MTDRTTPESLSVIIPVYNEEDSIETILDEVLRRMTPRDSDWEVIVVDNASTDRTGLLTKPYEDTGRVTYLRNDVNRGKGFSIQRGMLAATGQLRLMCDADCVDSLDSLEALETAARHRDVVCGSRSVRGAQVGIAQPYRRRFFSLGFLILTRLLLGRLVKDVYCGFKLWRADAAQDAFEHVSVTGWAFDAEALALAKRFGHTIDEVGIVWNDRRDSRLDIKHVIVPAAQSLIDARRNVRATSGRSRPAS